MKNRNSKLAIIITILFEIILAIAIVFNIISKEYKDLNLSFMGMGSILIPFIITKIANMKKINLPDSFQLISVVFIILAQGLGEIMKFYTKFWWWDLFLHGMFGCFGVIIGFNLVRGIIIKPNEVSKERFLIFILIFAFCFSITLGTAWEMFEFISDYFFKTDLVNGGLEDTATDLLIKMFGAFVTCIILYRAQSKEDKKKIRI